MTDLLLVHCRHLFNKNFAFSEQKISELSVTIGTYEKQRFDDQSCIQKLKHKLENVEQITTTTTAVEPPRDDELEDTDEITPNSPVKEKMRTSSSDEYARYFDPFRLPVLCE